MDVVSSRTINECLQSATATTINKQFTSFVVSKVKGGPKILLPRVGPMFRTTGYSSPVLVPVVGVALYWSTVVSVLVLPRIPNPKAYVHMHIFIDVCICIRPSDLTPHLSRFSFSSCRFALFLRGHDSSTIACLSKINGHTPLAAFSC